MNIKVGVIGMGQMGKYNAEIYQNIPSVDLVPICEYSDERRKEMQEKFGMTAYRNNEEMSINPKIDAFSIVLHDNIHREAVELAVENNKHILLEKTLAKTLEDGKALYDITKDYDKVFTVGFLLRFDPRFNMVKQSLDSGELGD